MLIAESLILFNISNKSVLFGVWVWGKLAKIATALGPVSVM